MEDKSQVILPGRIASEEIFPASRADFKVSYIATHSSSKNAGKVRVIECGASSDSDSVESGELEPVVLLHGWGASAYSYSRIMLPVAGSGRRVVAIDFPGHGLSYKPDDDSFYTIANLLKVVEDVWESLGLDRAVLVGHSMGGAVAAYFAAEFPERISALYLVAPAGFEKTSMMKTATAAVSSGMVRGMLPRLVSKSIIHTVLRMAFADSGKITEEDIEQYWAPSKFPEYSWAVRALLLNFDWLAGTHLHFERITAPTTVLYSSVDNLVSEEAALRYKGVISGSTAIKLEGVGHAITDEAPEAVVSAILGGE